MLIKNLNEFNGIILDTKQRKNLSEYVKSVLGDAYYAMTEDFFESVWKSSAEYKVFFARRCLNIMYTMYRIKYASPSELTDPYDFDFYSDSALLENASEIAESYLKRGIFPKILIADDILIHGRTLSLLIISFINAVYEEIAKRKSDVDKSEVEDDILSSITIRIMVRSNNPLLIPQNFLRCLKCKSDRSDVWTPARWHELSSRLSLIAAEGFFCNTSFILSLYENDNSDMHLKFEEAAKRAGFRKNSWSNVYARDAWVKPLVNSAGDTIAVYTLRLVQCFCDQKYRIIPFLIVPGFSDEALRKHDKLCRLIDKYFSNSNSFSKSRTEALHLLLSHNLLLLLDKQTEEQLVREENLDIDKVSINFKCSHMENYRSNFVKEVACLDQPILSWGEMDELILECTDGLKPLFTSSHLSFADPTVSSKNLLEDLLAKEGESREKEAHLAYTGKLRIISGTGRNIISELLNKLSGYDITEIMGSLLRCVDMGIAAISTRLENGKSICVYRPGEQSLFIHARRYANEMPVLISMEKDCVWNKDEIIRRVRKFYGDDSLRTQEIIEYVETLYSMGHRISDWDINFFKWTEISDSVKKQFAGKDKNEMLRTQMFIDAAERIKSMEKYRNMFE